MTTEVPNLRISFSAAHKRPNNNEDNDVLLVEDSVHDETLLDVSVPAPETASTVSTVLTRIYPNPAATLEEEEPQEEEEDHNAVVVSSGDPLDDELQKKAAHRARLYNLGVEDQLATLKRELAETVFKRLKIVDRESAKQERGVRFNAVHIRGVNHMSTDDIFNYFSAYPPAHVEWIDDLHANVVWKNDASALRSLIFMALPDALGEKEEPPKPKKKKKVNPATVTMAAPVVSDVTTVNGDAAESEEKPEEGMDVDEVDRDPEVERIIAAAEGVEEDSEDEDALSTDSDAILQPPEGHWLKGRWCSKSRAIFLRYATRNDRKQRGADKKSKYYQRHGNPNFYGMTGVISKSLRDRLRGNDSRAVRVAKFNSTSDFENKRWAGYDVSLEMEGDLRDLGDGENVVSKETPVPEKQQEEEELEGMNHEKELELLLRNRKQLVSMKLVSDVIEEEEKAAGVKKEVMEKEPKDARQKIVAKRAHRSKVKTESNGRRVEVVEASQGGRRAVHQADLRERMGGQGKDLRSDLRAGRKRRKSRSYSRSSSVTSTESSGSGGHSPPPRGDVHSRLGPRPDRSDKNLELVTVVKEEPPDSDVGEGLVRMAVDRTVSETTSRKRKDARSNIRSRVTRSPWKERSPQTSDYEQQRDDVRMDARAEIEARRGRDRERRKRDKEKERERLDRQRLLEHERRREERMPADLRRERERERERNRRQTVRSIRGRRSFRDERKRDHQRMDDRERRDKERRYVISERYGRRDAVSALQPKRQRLEPRREVPTTRSRRRSRSVASSVSTSSVTTTSSSSSSSVTSSSESSVVSDNDDEEMVESANIDKPAAE